MNRKQLCDEVAAALSVTPSAADSALQAVLDTITEAIAAGERVQITGFGTFERRERSARTGRNLHTGAAIEIAAAQAPAFKPAGAFKDAVRA